LTLIYLLFKIIGKISRDSNEDCINVTNRTSKIGIYTEFKDIRTFFGNKEKAFRVSECCIIFFYNSSKTFQGSKSWKFRNRVIIGDFSHKKGKYKFYFPVISFYPCRTISSTRSRISL